jgi:hypothetical protein
MKMIFAISILLSMNISAKAVDKEPSGFNANATDDLKIYPKKRLTLEKGMANLYSENIGALSQKLCGYFVDAGRNIP